jgi:hypothetical protein
MNQALFNSLQREKKETNYLDGKGSQDANVTGYIGDTKPVKQCEEETIENSQDSRSMREKTGSVVTPHIF